MLFVGMDWAEDHHDVCVMAEAGAVLGTRRVADSVAGIGELHGLVAEHADDDEQICVGVEIDRGLVVWSLLEAGYQVYAINPLASSRYRDRHARRGQVRPGRRQGAGRPGAHRPAQPPAHSRRQDWSEGVKLLAPERHLGPPAPGQRPALRAAGVLPGCAQAFGTDWPPRCAGRSDHRPRARARPRALTVQDRRRLAPWRAPAQRRAAGRGDPRSASGPSSSRHPSWSPVATK